jgi:UDP-N-acetyl-D-galactosamine dehydrogenase
MQNNKKIAVIGLGYVGLPLAVEFSKKMHVYGFDLNQSRIQELEQGFDKTFEISMEELHAVKKTLALTSDLSKIKDCNTFIVTVPTPIDELKKPDLRPLISATEMVATFLKPGDLVVYESTVYPGCTEEICLPILENISGVSRELFYVGYSPERINPGDRNRKLTDIIKITSGNSKEASEKVNDLYKQIILAGTHVASSIKVAEAAKVIENTQRDLNIALINELAMLFAKMDIDTEEVLMAAETKWNFISFRPGLVGGHCIGVDPYYLTHKAQQIGFTPKVILSGRAVNDEMGMYVASTLLERLRKRYHANTKFKVLVLGLTFKENCPDIRNTRVVDIIAELNAQECEVDVADPWAYFTEAMNEYHINLIGSRVKGVGDDGKNISADIFYKTLTAQKYHGIVIAVSHKQFSQISSQQIRALGIDENCIIFDLKHVYSKERSDMRL